LLDFDLVARFKQINTMKLYVPGRGEFSYPLLGPTLTAAFSEADVVAQAKLHAQHHTQHDQPEPELRRLPAPSYAALTCTDDIFGKRRVERSRRRTR
jgi:hypothetical protein